MSRSGFLLLTVLTTASCATSHTSAPSANDVTAPKLEYALLQRLAVAVNVLDQRVEREGSLELIAATRTVIQRSLLASGVRVAPEGPVRLEVRITKYRADFELGQWRGCTTFMVDVVTPAGTVSDPAAETCVRKANVWGFETADSALKQSWGDAVSQMLSNLDRRRALPQAAEAAPRTPGVQL